MKAMRKALPLALLIAALAGCDSELSIKNSSQPRNDDLLVYGGNNAALQSGGVSTMDNTNDGGTITDAVAVHEKYIQALEEKTRLVQELSRLRETSRDQSDKLSALTRENAQLKRELADANGMLVAMRGELDKWKADIFHYRKELQDALATIRLLQERTIRILGGDVAGAAVAEAPKPGEPGKANP